MQTLKTVVVGDGAVGKTTLLLAKTYNCFSQDYVPTVFDNFAVIVPVGGRPVGIGLWDTAGQEDYDKVRHAAYGSSGEVDLALVLFSVVNPASFENLRGKWLPEVKKYAPHVPIILVGTKTDLRNDEATVKKLHEAGKAPISVETARKFAKKHECVTYLECSSVQQTGITEVFLEIVRTHINCRAGKRPGKWCWDPACDKPLGLTAKKLKCYHCLLKYCPEHADKVPPAADAKKAKEQWVCHKCAGKPITTVLDERRRLREEQEKAEAEARAKEAADKAAAGGPTPSATTVTSGTPAPATAATPSGWDADSSSSSSAADKPEKPEKEKEPTTAIASTPTATVASGSGVARPEPTPAPASADSKKDTETDSQVSRGLAAAPADLQAEGSGPAKKVPSTVDAAGVKKDKKEKHDKKEKKDKTKKHADGEEGHSADASS